MRRVFIALFVIASTVVGPSTFVQAGPARRSEAGEHFDTAAELYAREDYAGAAREFAIAYALEPRVDVLFAWAQAERLAEHYEEALELYERLLDGELSANQRESVEALRFEVSGELVIAQGRAPTVAEAPEASTTDEATTDEAGVSDKPPASHERGRAGVGLIGVGVGITALGGGLLLGAAIADSRVRAAETYPEFEAAFDPRTGRGRGAVALYASGGVLAAVGLATLITGAVRLTRARHRGERPPARTVAITPWLGREQAGLVLTIGSWR
jgi:tetratricopeptide (TPR) repeat protein